MVEQEVGALLSAEGLKLCTAESCTGGLLAHRITNVPGSSAYYLGGFVAYANEVKEALLGVRHETLLTYGAVSEATAREMALGARHCLGADLGLSITGIAGPTGGTPEKPVGSTYIALSTAEGERCEYHIWDNCGVVDDRLRNKAKSAEAALRLLLTYLQKSAGSKGSGGMTVEFINAPVSVEVQQRGDGTLRPLALFWRDQRFKIESWGRESSKTQDERTLDCYLVQTTGGETWELCQDRETAQWKIARHWARCYRAV
jgi:nicotinamide-nucleotide amidase